MKTAVSVPDELFTRALREYVERFSTRRLTEQMNDVCDKLGADNRLDDAVKAARAKVLADETW